MTEERLNEIQDWLDSGDLRGAWSIIHELMHEVRLLRDRHRRRDEDLDAAIMKAKRVDVGVVALLNQRDSLIESNKKLLEMLSKEKR